MNSGSHLIINIFVKISPLQHSQIDSKLTFLGWHSACLSKSLGCLEWLSNSQLSVFGQHSRGPASLSHYHENLLTWANYSLVVPLELPLASAHTGQPTRWLSWEPSDLSGLNPDSPPWLSCKFALEFPLRFICRTVTAYCILYTVNPNPYGWGRIWLPKLWRGITLQRLK